MAYEKKNGDISLWTNTQRTSEYPHVASGKIYINGEDRNIKIYSNDQAEGKQPERKGSIDLNGVPIELVAWVKKPNAHPKAPILGGYITFKKGEQTSFGVWPNDYKNGNEKAPDFTGKVQWDRVKTDGFVKDKGASPNGVQDNTSQLSKQAAVQDDFDDSDLPF